MKSIINKFSPSLIICIIIVTLIFSFGCTKKRKINRPFRIAIVTWVGYGPFYIAQEKGYYEEEGIDVKIVKIEDEGARRSAFTTGDVQGAINTIDALASGVPQGVPGKVIFKIDDSYGGDGIVARKEINNIADLKGKTVAYPKGLPSHFFLLYLLDKEGMSINDIVSRTMEAGDAGVAFVAKKVDAAVTWEPWLSKANETEHGHILLTSKESPGLIVDIFMISPATIKKRPEDVKKLMNAWFKAIKFVKKNPEESNEIMAKYLGVPKDDIAGMVQGIKFADYEENLRYFGLKPGTKDEFSKVFEKAGEIWKGERVIEMPAKASDVLETSFLENLYK